MLLQAIHSASAPSNWYRQCHFGDALRSCTPSAVTLLLAAMACQTAAAAPAQSNASIPRYECPPSVPVGVSSAAALPGWATYIDSDLYLHSATPIDGPPEKRGELADYTTKPGKRLWSYTYDLDRDFADGIWLECGYGTHNEVTLSRRMPSAIKTCTFTYRKGEKAGQNIIKIDCR